MSRMRRRLRIVAGGGTDAPRQARRKRWGLGNGHTCVGRKDPGGGRSLNDRVPTPSPLRPDPVPTPSRLRPHSVPTPSPLRPDPVPTPSPLRCNGTIADLRRSARRIAPRLRRTVRRRRPVGSRLERTATEETDRSPWRPSPVRQVRRNGLGRRGSGHSRAVREHDRDAAPSSRSHQLPFSPASGGLFARGPIRSTRSVQLMRPPTGLLANPAPAADAPSGARSNPLKSA